MGIQGTTLCLDILFEVVLRLDTRSAVNLTLITEAVNEALGPFLLRKTLQREKENFLAKHVYSTAALKHFIEGGFAREFDTVRHVALTCRTKKWSDIDANIGPFDVLKLHFNIDARDTNNRTVLSSLMTTHPIPTLAIEALLEAGADPNGDYHATDGVANHTPLSLLFTPRRWEHSSWIEMGPTLLRIVKSLVKHGASTTPQPHGVNFLGVVLQTIWDKLGIVAKQAASLLGPSNLSLSVFRPLSKRDLIRALSRVDITPYYELCDVLIAATPAWQEPTLLHGGKPNMLWLLERADLMDSDPDGWFIHFTEHGLFRIEQGNKVVYHPGVTFNGSSKTWAVDYSMPQHIHINTPYC
ncbi:hypothetical protein F5X98DRAFT_372861 [Xylaria grammica]|nr:hypothetical protein F5X98DRAFT_372861 [Xylaria grammica]